MTLKSKVSNLLRISRQVVQNFANFARAWAFNKSSPAKLARARIIVRKEGTLWEVHFDQTAHLQHAFSSSPLSSVTDSAWGNKQHLGAVDEQKLSALSQSLLTALPEPHLLVKSLRLPPCSSKQLPAAIAKYCEQEWPGPRALCATFAVWGKSLRGWNIHVFAATKVAIQEHFESLSKHHLIPDLCAPESLALSAYFEKYFPGEKSTILVHVEPTYCTLLLLMDKEIVGQQVVLGSFDSKNSMRVDMRARLRQALQGLRNRFVERKLANQVVSCKASSSQEVGFEPKVHQLTLLCTGMVAQVDWLSLAQIKAETQEHFRLLAAPLSAQWAVAEGLMELNRGLFATPAHLAPFGVQALSLPGRCPFLKRSLRRFALMFSFTLGVLSLVQYRRISSQARLEFAKLASDMGAIYSDDKRASSLKKHMFQKRTLRSFENGTLRSFEKGTLRALEKELGAWNKRAATKSIGAFQVLQWLWQSLGNSLNMGLALRKFEICTEENAQAFASPLKVSFAVAADKSVDTRELAARLRQWHQIDRNLPERWRADEGLLIADFFLKRP